MRRPLTAAFPRRRMRWMADCDVGDDRRRWVEASTIAGSFRGNGRSQSCFYGAQGETQWWFQIQSGRMNHSIFINSSSQRKVETINEGDPRQWTITRTWDRAQPISILAMANTFPK
jgi:hypothetical protein